MKHLLAISIGPVQEFIAAARRTADLYAGSQLLVEIAKTVARTVQNSGGKLIFPSDPNKDGPNKIVAEITNGEPEEIAQACWEAALKTLREAWEEAKKKIREAWEEAKKKIPKDVLDETLADHQIQTLLEFYAAWLPYDGTQYEAVRQELDRLLAGRKALRNFEQPEPPKDNNGNPKGRYKSPLDPSRECALKIWGTDPVPDAYQTEPPLWLKTRETLDAISLLKRVKGGEFDVPSTSLMAARAVLIAAEEKGSSAPNELKKLAKNLSSRYRVALDEGDLMFKGRLDEEIPGLSEEEKQKIDQLCKAVLEAARRAGYKGSDCPPYYAILVADGDRMGALIGELRDIEKHRNFSAALSSFAEKAKKIVEHYNGHLVYSGGDDVLALLPVNRALDCAAELAKQFRAILEGVQPVKDALDSLQSQKKPGGTLSIGVAIVHHLEPLLVSLQRARAAEKEAKKKRNALAVALHTRAGEPMTVSQPWNGAYTTEEWNKWITAFRGGLARGFPYELRRLAQEFQATGMPLHRLQAEATRIYDRKEGSAKPPLPDFHQDPKEMEKFAQKLIIARFLATYPEVSS